MNGLAMTEYHDNGKAIDSPGADFDRMRFITPESPCPYLSNRRSRSEAYYFDTIKGAQYEWLMARGYRRSGRVVYRPRCRGCDECKQIRIPVERFEPSKSMRRIRRRNADVVVACASPEPTDEKYDLFTSYLNHQHDEAMPRGRDAFLDFLYLSPLESVEFVYRLGNRIVGVSLADCCPGGLSSVYCYFDPGFAERSLGTFSVLWEVEHCREQGLAFYYMGYYVADCPAMAYKIRFRPSEVLVDADRWLTINP
jgi:arginine-tRNA-protein transferase